MKFFIIKTPVENDYLQSEKVVFGIIWEVKQNYVEDFGIRPYCVYGFLTYIYAIVDCLHARPSGYILCNILRW